MNAGYTYDNAGNMTHDATAAYTFDGANRLTTVNNNGGPSATATYTYFGQLRITKATAGATALYIYSGTKVIAEYASGAAPASPSKEYIYAGSQLVASIAASTTTYYHPDHLSNRAETDSSGTVTRRMGSFPYGESWYDSPSQEKWKFSSYERDLATGETGLDYAQFRYYASGQGRFMGADRMGGSATRPQSLNRYTYVNNDPVNEIDPLGLWSSWSCSGSDGEGNVSCVPDPDNVDDGGRCPPGLDACDGEEHGGDTTPRKPSISKGLYDKCAKEAFGSITGKIPGTDKSIPGLDAASMVFDAATFVGADPSVVAATFAIENNSNLTAGNSGTNGNGSVDIGPMQLNTRTAGQPGGYPLIGNALGTNLGPHQAFNGDVYANIATGANYLRMLGPHANRYVGNDPSRQGALEALMPALDKFFDCIRKGLGLK